jgi:hypothetical protein
LCEALGWKQANGALRDVVCRGLLLTLERAGEIELPPVRWRIVGQRRTARPRPKAVLIDTTPLTMPLGALDPIELRLVRRTADEPLFHSRENQGPSASNVAPQLRRGIIRQSALHRGAGTEEIDLASQELAVLQEPKWGADGRPVHELDPHLRTQPRQSV